MAPAFVPLVASTVPRDSTAFRLKVVNGKPESGATPKSRLVSDAPAQSAATAPHAATVNLVREGDRITGARVDCVCGQVIELTFTF